MFVHESFLSSVLIVHLFPWVFSTFLSTPRGAVSWDALGGGGGSGRGTRVAFNGMVMDDSSLGWVAGN